MVLVTPTPEPEADFTYHGVNQLLYEDKRFGDFRRVLVAEWRPPVRLGSVLTKVGRYFNLYVSSRISWEVGEEVPLLLRGD